MEATHEQYMVVEQFVNRNFPGHVMKDWPDELVEHVALTGEFDELEAWLACEACGVRDAKTDADHKDGCPLAMYDDPKYVEYMEEQLAVHEGRATALTHCYVCYFEQTGQSDTSPKSDMGPLRGIMNDNDVCFGFNRAASARVGYDGDPYTVLTLSCGHRII